MTAATAFDPRILRVETEPLFEGFHPLVLHTERGPVECHLYPSTGSAGLILVGGAGGGWDSPAKGLYRRLAGELPSSGVTCLRVRFRNPHRLLDCVHDVLAGAQLLEREGIDAIGLVGHSLGGAVVIAAAARCPLVRTVVALAPQSLGAEAAGTLGPRCSLLIAHGTEDHVIPLHAGMHLYEAAAEPKDLLLCKGTGHVLGEVADELHARIRAWLLDALASPPLTRPEHPAADSPT